MPVENVPAPWRFGLSGNLLTRTQFWREKCNAHIKRRFYKSLVTANEQKSSNLAVEAEDDQLLAAHCTFPLLASSWFLRVHWWSTECTHLTASIGLDFEYSLLPHFLFRIVVRLGRRSCHGVLSNDLIVTASSILVFCAQWLNDISHFGNLRMTMDNDGCITEKNMRLWWYMTFGEKDLIHLLVYFQYSEEFIHSWSDRNC